MLIRTIETYLEHSDELAKHVVDAWALNMTAGNGGICSFDSCPNRSGMLVALGVFPRASLFLPGATATRPR